MLEGAAYCKVHPGIGIARIGNSPDAYFVGPEIPGVVVVPPGGYKDDGDIALGVPPRVKRQAARFRIYAYDAAGVMLGEVTLDDAEISWTVHLVNNKAEGDRFAGKAGEDLPLGRRRPQEAWRNSDIEDRASLIIDPGPRTVRGPNDSAHFDGGRFRGIEVALGEARTDTEGRLIVLGGFGVSASSNPLQRISNYANNDRWYDDVSDGPVTATVKLKTSRTLEVRPAWVIVAPPDFAPSVPSIVTLYDVATDVALRNSEVGPVPDRPGDRPSFTRHIAPIFERLSALQWVQQDARGAGAAAAEFADLGALAAANAERRNAVFARFRNPTLAATSEEAKRQATSDFLPALSGDSGDANPGESERWLSVTLTQYDALDKWRAGSFVNDWSPTRAAPRQDLTPEGLDRAALEACAGGAFYPGIEAGWILRKPEAYAEPYRLSHERLGPGEVTRQMACPWQADFYECRWHWWPAQRPDEVLTLEAYRRLREIEEALDNRDPESEEAERLRTEHAKLLRDRASWSRGLPAESYDGDVAMIERWAQHGFVVSADEGGGVPQLANGRNVLIEKNRGRYDGLTWAEYFHILTNIEQHPDFLPKARELAHWFFAHAQYDADENYQPFAYSPEAFDARMKKIYDNFVDAMNEPSRMDTGLVQWPVVVRREGDKEVTKLIEFDVKPFSNRVVKERLRQRAPFNLVDGAWLQRIQPAGPVDGISSHLFAIWDDEAGNGRAEQNHCNVYDTLLRGLNIYMPAISTRQFVEQDLLPSAFVQPVFQLVVSLFPNEFYPELLGMTLYLEWEASPTLTPIVRHYRGRGIDPHFYSLHVAIDNIAAGHGFLAKEAIKLYLQRTEEEAGLEGVEEAWRRIWTGYVTWATTGKFGLDLLELCLKIDRKRIDISYPLMLLVEQVNDPMVLTRRLADAATGSASEPFAAYLVSRFQSEVQAQLRNASSGEAPARTLVGACVDQLNRLVQDDESFFAADRFTGTALGDDTAALVSKAVKGEDLVRLNRLLLRDGFRGVIGDIPTLEPRWFPDYRAYYKRRFVDLVKRKAYAAKPLHRGVIVGQHSLAELFDDPELLADVLATSDLVDIEHPRSSRLMEALNFSGPMYKIFTDDEKTIILDWIESLQKPQGGGPHPGPTPQEAAAKVLALITRSADAASHQQRHAQYRVDGRPLKDWFSDPVGLMGAFARSPDWVVPGNSNASQLYREFSTGRMSFMGTPVAEDIKRWIDLGAVLPAMPDMAAADTLAASAIPVSRQHGAEYVLAPDAVVSASIAVAPPTKPTRRDFAGKRKLIGMGVVH